MRTEDFKALTPFEQQVIQLLDKIEVHAKATYNLLAMEDAERNQS